ncbi:MAG: RNA polymerase sigma factor [Planctomycetes bacterium]|nr:RNA polymerase sigma factor [Planctomycetota bacterium]
MENHSDPITDSGHSLLPDRCNRDELVCRHWPEVYRLMYRMTANVHDAEELTQETFLRALAKITRFREGSSARAWLLRIAVNACLDTRKRPGKKTISLQQAGVDMPAPSISPSKALEDGELAPLLQSAILQLPESPRAVFLLRATEGMAFREIAETIGTTEETARWHMLQARRFLTERLDGKL